MHLQRGTLFLTIAGVLLAAQQRAQGALVMDPVSGHVYERVDAGLQWAQARDAAAAEAYLGTTGHLVTITSQEENDFLVTQLGGDLVRNHWIGGYQPLGSAEPAGGYRWVTNEPFIYTNWFPGEPSNNFNGLPENTIELIGTPNTLGKWNDAYELGPKGYIVEFDTVPEPASGLAASSLLAAWVGGRRRRRA